MGYNLKPSDSPQTIQVKVIAPKERNNGFTGTIKVINMDNPNDYDTIDVSLLTSKSKIDIFYSLRYIIQSIFHL
ncbi:MAG TPA: hypothetical protein ENI44_02620 [Thermoplasmatales archaeon]|nr:hypothetical protein [Thermoplasmatales archaeon]